MAQDDNRTVVLRVQLDEAETEKKLGQLTLDLEKTKLAQAALTAERKAGKLTDEQFAQQSVQLRNQLAAQRTEYGALEKNLNLYRKAQAGEANSYQATQAALSLAIRQQQQLADSADNSGEASQALTRQIEQYRATLAATDAQQGAFFRQIGNYPRGSEGLEQLVQQLVTLQEQQKRTVEGTQQAEEITRRIGYVQTAAAQAGAAQGLSYEQTTAKLQQYREALRPATAALLQLEEEQQALAQSGEQTGEAYTEIGFKIGAAKKAVQEATAAMQQVPEQVEAVEAPTASFGNTLAELDGKTGAFGGQVSNLKQRFTQAKQGIELAKVGFSGLKGAIASTGIGVLVLALGALVQYFTQTDEGSEDLAAALAFLKGLVQPLIGLFTSLGKGAVEAAKNPKQAFSDLVDFLESQVLNRLKAFGVIIDALKNGDLKGLANGVIQMNTGIEDGIGKMQALGREATRAANAATAISRAKDRLEDQEIAAIARNEQQKQQAERLVLTAKDRNLTEAQRLANLDKAGKLETEVLNRNLGIERARYAILLQQNAEKVRTGTLSDEERKEAEEQLAKLTQLQGEYDKQLQVIENRRSMLQAQEAEKVKAAAAKAKQEADKREEQRLKNLRESYALDGQLLDSRLRKVRAGSDEELSILQQKLRTAYLSELAQKDLTVKQKKVIDAKYENDSLALTLDFNRKKVLVALQAQVDLTAAQLAGQQAGSDEALRLQAEQLERQRKLALAGLDERADNEAKTQAINAQSANQQRQLEYNEATRLLTEYLDKKRQLLDLDHAKGLTTDAVYQQQLLDLERAGVQAQAVVNADYQQSNAANAKKAAEVEIKEAQRVTDTKKKQKETEQQIQEMALQAATETTDLLIENLGRESAAGQAAMVLKKTLGIAEIALNLSKQLSANQLAAAGVNASYPTLAPEIGAAYLAVSDSLAVVAAATATANILKLQQGGIAYGPSHEQGGIPLYHQGRAAGIEIEGGEAVISKQATAMFLPVLSLLNQAGGGRALAASMPSYNFAALGAITRPVAQEWIRQLGNMADAAAIGAAVAASLRKNPAVNRWVDFKAAEERNKFTDSHSNN